MKQKVTVQRYHTHTISLYTTRTICIQYLYINKHARAHVTRGMHSIPSI